MRHGTGGVGILGLITLMSFASCIDDTPAPLDTETVCKVRHVVDGDTLHLDCGAGLRKVRLMGYDTPESHAPHCAAEAQAAARTTAFLQALVNAGPVTGVRVTGQDRNGRDLDYIEVAGQDITQAMLASGLALPYAGHAHPNWCGILKS
jgi:micrococcal nuclease